MARNAEKAMTALARWRRMKMEEERGPQQRRPALTSDCTDLKEAERWRLDVIREIAKKIAQIQNPGLGEFKIRDLNDEINKMLRIKYHWELRIKELGGPDYKRTAPKMLDREGREVPGNRGYKYFGAAKDLPGVRELFEKPVFDAGKKNRTELARFIDADYYGYMEDDDGVLIPLEKAEEQRQIALAVEEWKQTRSKSSSGKDEVLEDFGIYKEMAGADEEEMDEYLGNFPNLTDTGGIEYGPAARDDEDQPKFIAHVNVPSQKDVEEALLRRKKMELLEKYVGETLLAAQSQEARALFGYQDSDVVDHVITDQDEPPESSANV